jgi:hypothetical protein
MRPDGTGFNSIIPGLRWGASYHFAAELSGGDIVSTEYHNGNNHGFGTILAVSGTRNPALPPFGDADPQHPSNPLVQYGFRTYDTVWGPNYTKYTFSPQGLRNLTQFTFGSPDDPSPKLPNGQYAGKATHPAAAPNNDMLFIYSPGVVNKAAPADVWGQIRILRGGAAIDDPNAAEIVRADPNYNYLFPQAVLTYKQLYGIERPPYIPYLPNGTVPYGLVGTASLINRDTTPGTGIKIGNQRMTPRGLVNLEISTAWSAQGSEAGAYTDSDIYGVRIIAMDPAFRTNAGPVFDS